MARKVKVVEKKLGRHKVKHRGRIYHVDGFAYIGQNRIEIEPRLSPKKKFLTHQHEAWHIVTGSDDEKGASEQEKIADIMWDIGYRQLPKRFRD